MPTFALLRFATLCLSVYYTAAALGARQHEQRNFAYKVSEPAGEEIYSQKRPQIELVVTLGGVEPSLIAKVDIQTTR